MGLIERRHLLHPLLFNFLLENYIFFSFNDFFPCQQHLDIFDLVSGLQKEAFKEEKLQKERRRELKERKRLKESHNKREQEKEVDREKEKDNEEVLCRDGLKDFEFLPNIVL